MISTNWSSTLVVYYFNLHAEIIRIWQRFFLKIGQKLDGLGLLIKDPTPTSSTTLAF